MGSKKPTYSEEQWMTRQVEIYYWRCFKGKNCKEIAEALTGDGDPAPTIAEVKKQMTAWNFGCGITWDFDKTPPRFLEYMGIETSFSDCSSQCHHSSTSSACKICASRGLAEPCTAPHFHCHDTFGIANRKSGQTGRPLNQDVSKMQQESLSHDSTVVQRPSTIDTAVHLGPEFFTPSYGHNSMSFGPRNDFLPLTGPVYPPTVRTGTLDYEAPADLTGHARNQSVHCYPQTDQSLPIHHSYSVNPYARLGDGSSTDMTGVQHAQRPLLFPGTH